MIPCNRCKCSSVERRGLYKSCFISECLCLCLTVPIPSEANRKWFHQLMFGNISPVQCVEARPGFLLSGAELSQSSADSGATTLLLLLQWVTSSLQSVRLALLHRWSLISDVCQYPARGPSLQALYGFSAYQYRHGYYGYFSGFKKYLFQHARSGYTQGTLTVTMLNI